MQIEKLINKFAKMADDYDSFYDGKQTSKPMEESVSFAPIDVDLSDLSEPRSYVETKPMEQAVSYAPEDVNLSDLQEEIDQYNKDWEDEEEDESEDVDLDGINQEELKGGEADGLADSLFDPEQLAKGIKHELEHTKDAKKAKEIAKDHLVEDPEHYTKLEKAGL
jgi:hypothetical protein